MIVSFGTGDYSDDGHGKYDSYLAEIPDEFTFDQIKEAYEKSKEELGFGLEDIGCDFESSITDHEVEALYKFGVDIPESWGWDLVNKDDSSTVLTAIRDMFYEADDGAGWLLAFETMVKRHLPGFWAVPIAPKQYRSLFGQWGSEIIVREQIGYGYYHA